MAAGRQNHLLFENHLLMIFFFMLNLHLTNLMNTLKSSNGLRILSVFHIGIIYQLHIKIFLPFLFQSLTFFSYIIALTEILSWSIALTS